MQACQLSQIFQDGPRFGILERKTNQKENWQVGNIFSLLFLFFLAMLE